MPNYGEIGCDFLFYTLLSKLFMMFADDVACWLLVLLPMMLPPQNLSSFLFFQPKAFPHCVEGTAFGEA